MNMINRTEHQKEKTSAFNNIGALSKVQVGRLAQVIEAHMRPLAQDSQDYLSSLSFTKLKALFHITTSLKKYWVSQKI